MVLSPSKILSGEGKIEDVYAKLKDLEKLVKVYNFDKSASVSYSGTNSIGVHASRQGNLVSVTIQYTGTLPKEKTNISSSTYSNITIPEGFRPTTATCASYVGVAGTAAYEADNGRFSIETNGSIYHISTEATYHERNVNLTYYTADDFPTS